MEGHICILLNGVTQKKNHCIEDACVESATTPLSRLLTAVCIEVDLPVFPSTRFGILHFL